MCGDFHYKDKMAVRQFCLSIQVRRYLYIEKAHSRPLEDTVRIIASLFVAKVGKETGPRGPKLYQI